MMNGESVLQIALVIVFVVLAALAWLPQVGPLGFGL